MELDHVLFAVEDLAAADRELEARYGPRVSRGRPSYGLGTANRIVPLGDTYLELISIVDQAEAVTSTLGRWVSPCG